MANKTAWYRGISFGQGIGNPKFESLHPQLLSAQKSDTPFRQLESSRVSGDRGIGSGVCKSEVGTEYNGIAGRTWSIVKSCTHVRE